MLVGYGSELKGPLYMFLQARNIQTEAEFSLYELVGQIYAMTAAHDMLFAGAQVIS
jgi:pleiotropic regulator 1